MPSWSEVERAAPELAAAVRGRFDAHRHKVLGTLRADGSPRLSGIEVTFRDGEMWLGMMPGSRKASDLRADPRLAVHSATADPDLADGDARITGRAVEVTDPGAMAALIEGDDRQGDAAPEGSSSEAVALPEGSSSEAVAPPGGPRVPRGRHRVDGVEGRGPGGSPGDQDVDRRTRRPPDRTALAGPYQRRSGGSASGWRAVAARILALRTRWRPPS